jgi:hypothetical protein
MRLHRFQIYLLLLLQVILPSGAPWLHQVLDGQCCSAHPSCPVVDANIHDHSGHSHCCCAHHKHESTSTEEASGQSSGEDSEVPHDCSNCVLCQTLAAPRIVAEIISLPQSDEWIAFVHGEPAADDRAQLLRSLRVPLRESVLSPFGFTPLSRCRRLRRLTSAPAWPLIRSRWIL